MKKVAVFTEGQGELIFIRYILPIVFGYENLSFECVKLHRDRLLPVPYSVTLPNPSIHFLIVNVTNDSRVMSAIKEREENLLNKGYDVVIGLRDMYSEKYRKRSLVIDDRVTNAFKEEHNLVIQKMSNPSKIEIYFAIMEFEAWLLGMYSLFAKIHQDLTVDFIEEKLSFNLESISPETEFW